MNARLLAATALIAACAAACHPPVTEHSVENFYPTDKSDFAARWIGLGGGRMALWISTADDGVKNGRYEGVQLVVDPGSPTEVGAQVIPFLEGHGLKQGGRSIAYVVLTSADPQEEAGAEALARAYPGTKVVAPTAGPARRRRASDPMEGYLSLGAEVTARLLKPKSAAGVPAQALLVRFINTQLVAFPPVEAAPAGWQRSVAGDLATEGLHTTIASAPDGLADDDVRATLKMEVIVGGGASTELKAIRFAAPNAGESVAITTNGGEVSAPQVTRSRFGHWIDCRGTGDACRATLDAGAAGGPLIVKLALPGLEPGDWLVDTRAPLSYLARPLYERMPGAATAKTTMEEHDADPPGVEVPPFVIASDAGSVYVRRWHVLPIEPFTAGGRPIAGILGMDLLQSFKLTLEPKKRRLTLAPNFAAEREELTPAKQVDGGAWDVPMDHSPAGPLILSKLDDRPASLVVDLASADSAVYLDAVAWKKKLGDAAGAPATRSWLYLGEGDPDDAVWKTLPLRQARLPVKDLNLFGAHFADRTFDAVDQPIEADLLGLDFLSGWSTVELDFRRRSLTLTP